MSGFAKAFLGVLCLAAGLFVAACRAPGAPVLSIELTAVPEAALGGSGSWVARFIPLLKQPQPVASSAKGR